MKTKEFVKKFKAIMYEPTERFNDVEFKKNHLIPTGIEINDDFSRNYFFDSEVFGFDGGWDRFIAYSEAGMKAYHKAYFDDMLDSFKEKMDEFIEIDDLFEPFIVKNKRNSDLDIKIDIKTDRGYSAFSILFKNLYGFDLDVLCDDFILPQLDAFNDEMGEYGTMILRHKDDERMTLMFDPTSRLGRFIVSVAAGMRMHKEEE